MPESKLINDFEVTGACEVGGNLSLTGALLAAAAGMSISLGQSVAPAAITAAGDTALSPATQVNLFTVNAGSGAYTRNFNATGGVHGQFIICRFVKANSSNPTIQLQSNGTNIGTAINNGNAETHTAILYCTAPNTWIVLWQGKHGV